MNPLDLGYIVTILDISAENFEPSAADGINNGSSVVKILNVANLQHGSVVGKSKFKNMLYYKIKIFGPPYIITQPPVKLVYESS